MTESTLLIVVVGLVVAFLLACVGVVVLVVWLMLRGERRVAAHLALYEGLAKDYAHGFGQTADYLLQMVTTKMRDDTMAMGKLIDGMGRPMVPEPRVKDHEWDEFLEDDDGRQPERSVADDTEGHDDGPDLDLDGDRETPEGPDHIGAFGPDFQRVAAAGAEGDGPGSPVAASPVLLRDYLASLGVGEPAGGVVAGAGGGGRPDVGARAGGDG